MRVDAASLTNLLEDQTHALDASRVSRYLGTLTLEEYAPVRAAVRLIFSL